MSIFTIGLGFLVLLVVGLLWFVIYYFNNPVLENPDGIAKVVGNCGDTMEIAIKFCGDKVADTHYWANGCSFSKNCAAAAATLAKHKTLDELKNINMISIMDVVGQLPDTHLHCAQLAETTLQLSVKNYLANQDSSSV